jgi:hypothetical protein
MLVFLRLRSIATLVSAYLWQRLNIMYDNVYILSARIIQNAKM